MRERTRIRNRIGNNSHMSIRVISRITRIVHIIRDIMCTRCIRARICISACRGDACRCTNFKFIRTSTIIGDLTVTNACNSNITITSNCTCIAHYTHSWLVVFVHACVYNAMIVLKL